ncbi:MAG: DUF799 family lipoprotein, partial [Desulfobacterales bacterium]
WLAAMLIIIFSGYLLYVHVYTPWKVQQRLAEVANQIEIGDYLPARDTLKQLLLTDLSAENAQTAKDMLAKITLAITQQKAEKGDINEAKSFLKNYLAEYGHGKEAEALWDRLDYYRLTLGEQYESLNKHQAALSEYSSIREDSLYFEEAQKAIRRIWLSSQQKNHQKQDIAQLVQEAETHFLAKRYLTPVNQNAYAVYQAILSLNPNHELALKRIEQIKTFYREHGEGYFKKGDWAKALSYFERYSIIDPESQEIKEKISACRQKLVLAKKGTKSARDNRKHAKNEENEKREEIQRLLEESGTESSSIMKKSVLTVLVIIFLTLGATSCAIKEMLLPGPEPLVKEEDQLPHKVAIIPFVNQTSNPEASSIVRKMFYNFFSSLNYIDLEPFVIDDNLKRNGLYQSIVSGEPVSAARMGQLLGVDAVVFGEVTSLGKNYALLYADNAAALKARMVRCDSE